MSIDLPSLRIVRYPDAVLRQPAREISEITDEVRRVADRMIELMHDAPGIGLAAPQVGLSWRMFVLHVPEDPDEGRLIDCDPPEATESPRVYINPRLSEYARDLVPWDEGCLSLPGITGEVRRPSQLTVTALDEHARSFSHRAGGLLARCIQHETDHLDGKLIIDRFTPIARMKNRVALRELTEGAAKA